MKNRTKLDSETQTLDSIIALKVGVSLDKNGFSLDELIIRIKELFDQKGMPGLVAFILDLVDAHVVASLTRDKPGWQPEPCCQQPEYELRDRPKRRIRTSIGVINLRWRRLRCVHCHHALVPLREFLQLDRYQSKSSELERIITEVISEQSYRRTSRHLSIIAMLKIPKSTAHRWVKQSDCDAISPAQPVPSLMVDGTAYKRRPDPTVGKDNRGELRVAIGVKSNGMTVPLGVWSGEPWDAIAKALKPADPDQAHLGKLLISDGEPGLTEALGPLTEDQQRCHWHQVHELSRYLYRQDAPIITRRIIQRDLAAILSIELPKQDFKQVPEADKVELEQRVRAAEGKLEELIKDLLKRGYGQAADYVKNAKEKLFTYVRTWLSCVSYPIG